MPMEYQDPASDAMKEKLEDLRRENRLLRDQLERLSTPTREEKPAYIPPWLKNPEFPEQYKELLSSNMRLKAQKEIYEKLLKGLFRIGEAGDEGGKSLKQLLKAMKRTNMAILGGKSFSKAAKAHAAGGVNQLEKLLDNAGANSKLRGDVYTTLARDYEKKDAKITEYLAWRAWESNPKLYRLKWYAFRLYSAGDVLGAMAVFDLLGDSVTFADSERDKLKRIRNEALSVIEERLDEELERLDEENAEKPNTYIPQEIAAQLENMDMKLGDIAASRARQVAFLLDFMEEQKEIIRKSSEDAWREIMPDLREELIKILAPASSNKSEVRET